MDAFTIKAPDVQWRSVDHGSAGAMITLKGKFFGTKRGKVYLGGKACKVITWGMDPVTGQSEASFLLPTGMTLGLYTITLSNKIGKGKIGGFTME